ncbi:MAG TPA: FAD:protein FMN transferase [Trebonia sp.]
MSPPSTPGFSARVRHAEHVMGTVVSFDVPSGARGDGSLDSAIRWLHRADEVFSTYREDSDISRIARGDAAVADCAPEVAGVLAAAEFLRESSGGYFTVYPAGQLDPSGYVKGWALERAARILAGAGSVSHVVNGGGDVQAVGARPGTAGRAGGDWRIGIASPLAPGALALVVAGRDFAVATSGTAERGAHIWNPVAGRPAAGLASVTVVGPSLTLADAYATAAFAMGTAAMGSRDWIESLDGYEAYAILPDGGTWQTSGFAGYIPAD